MIMAKRLFTTGDFRNSAKLKPWQRKDAEEVRTWLDRAGVNGGAVPMPLFAMEGPNAITEEQYEKYRSALRNAACAMPVGLTCDMSLILWAEDERALPDSLEEARGTLTYVALSWRHRLPL